ncbi:lysozyme [Variovorax sp. RKNM96]|uniref:N-acetylmuramoyl-L-alanine amidase n=1 Tax=Variovorax sp. RKNM96 TaxID=2681552 RepID=UPI001981227D|nr:N-acetylmuramoyl-L-alanine amidase [Variovorax sp. RKNM96]QSI31454.1 lysozyme [Variovorax sp. RKNM96]
MALRPLKAADVRFLVIHCSATPPTANIGAKDIDRWHRDKGWLCIGYHHVIRRDGTVEAGRPMDQPGAHVEGHNAESIGICLVGGVDANLKPENNFTMAQMQALIDLLKRLRPTYPIATIQGHRDFPGVAKACPSFAARDWAANLGL